LEWRNTGYYEIINFDTNDNVNEKAIIILKFLVENKSQIKDETCKIDSYLKTLNGFF